jgi:cell volume regulation protein A
VHEVTSFGAVVLLGAAALGAALLTSKLSERVSVPGAALFLVIAAVASDIFPSLALSISTVERIATLALIVILFDGGASIGWRRFRPSAAPIVVLGVVGTFATAGAVALFAHWALGFEWVTAGLIGAAIAPTVR